MVPASALLLPRHHSCSFRVRCKLPTRTPSTPCPLRCAPLRPSLHTQGALARPRSPLPARPPCAPTIRLACFVGFPCSHLPSSGSQNSAPRPKTRPATGPLRSASSRLHHWLPSSLVPTSI